MTQRRDVSFSSSGQICRGWLFLPAVGGNGKPPLIVMGHGLGAVKEMGLESYAECFVAQGYACLVFDYRHFGASDGEPRQLLDIHKQLQDWQAAVDFAHTLPEVDGKRLVLWGTSFGGGHVLVTGSRNPDVAAIIAQCPFTDGLASALAIDLKTSFKLTALALLDALGSLLGRKPIYIPLAAAPGVLAMMNTADAESGYLTLVPKGFSFRNEVAARVVLRIIGHSPGRIARTSKIPTLLCVCAKDSVAPAKATLRHAAKMPAAQVQLYPVGHFDIYSGEGFASVITDQTAFLARSVPVGLGQV
jgi:pimeloyl-ACP methyl ester carboxylesterase